MSEQPQLDDKPTKITMYLGGGKGIEKPLDANGNEIKVGDKLTWDFHDECHEENHIKDWMRKPIFVVEEHPSGKCLCGRGIEKKLYLHDFRFRYCEIIQSDETKRLATTEINNA